MTVTSTLEYLKSMRLGAMAEELKKASIPIRKTTARFQRRLWTGSFTTPTTFSSTAKNPCVSATVLPQKARKPYDNYKTDLRPRYAFWFKNLKDSSKAEKAILARFSEEPNELHVWSEQDNIYEQSRKIVEACEKAVRSLNRGSAPNPGV